MVMTQSCPRPRTFAIKNSSFRTCTQKLVGQPTLTTSSNLSCAQLAELDASCKSSSSGAKPQSCRLMSLAHIT